MEGRKERAEEGGEVGLKKGRKEGREGEGGGGDLRKGLGGLR